MSEEKTCYCQKCGKAYLVRETGQLGWNTHVPEEWVVTSLSPEYFTEIGELPLTVQQITDMVTTGEYQKRYGAVDKLREYRIAASKPFCVELGCGGELSETFLYEIRPRE